MIANAAWGLEFILAALGFLFFLRRRVHVMWIWLGFRAAADIACAVCKLIGPKAYNWADYINRNAQYVLIAIVSVWAVAAILREHRNTRDAYVSLLGALALFSVVLFHAHWPPSAEAVLKFETWADITLSGFVAFALAEVSGTERPWWKLWVTHAPKPWDKIAIGLVVMGIGDLLVTALRLRGWRAEGIYPVGEILALGILAVAGWKDWKCEEIRLPVPKKFPPSSVGKAEILEMFGG